jgi:hypothetical protein
MTTTTMTFAFVGAINTPPDPPDDAFQIVDESGETMVSETDEMLVVE